MPPQANNLTHECASFCADVEPSPSVSQVLETTSPTSTTSLISQFLTTRVTTYSTRTWMRRHVPMDAISEVNSLGSRSSSRPEHQ